jgi:hypothetical protein
MTTASELGTAGYEPSTDSPLELTAKAMSQVLRPLARLGIANGLQLPAMLEMLKVTYVEEAIQSFGISNRPITDSRIALLTGVHRKDVRRIRSLDARKTDDALMLPVSASVVARWISEPRFLNSDQSPRALARTPGRGTSGEPDFTDLVAEVSRDVGARAVLDELERLGVVRLRDDGFVVIESAAFVPRQGLSEKLHFFSSNVGAHLEAAVHNLSSHPPVPAMLEQSAFAEDLTESQAQMLQDRARQLWAQVLQQFLQTATVAWQRSEGSPGANHQVRFGVYFHDAVSQETPIRAPAKRKKPSKRSQDLPS